MSWDDVSPWTSRHADGHKVGMFSDGWWFYPAGWRGPLQAGPQPSGPFKSREEAKDVLRLFTAEAPLLMDLPRG